MLATDMTASGSPEEKLRWAFKMYDKDGSGCDLCADVEVHVDVGVIADQEAYVEVDADVIADHEFGGDAIL